MTEIISVHSFRRGTGKTTIALALAGVLAQRGQNVCLIDTDISSPGLHIMLGLDETGINCFLNDYLEDRCSIADAVVDATDHLSASVPGRIFLVPSNPSPSIAMQTRWDREAADRLADGYYELAESLNLDTVFVDTHAGITEESIAALATTDIAAIVLRPDQQDYQGTALLVDLARSLNVERLAVIVNELSSGYDPRQASESIQQTYKAQIVGIIPHSEDIMALGGQGPFPIRYPTHPLTAVFVQITDRLIQA
jgi:septum site-determining protein MinD